MRLSLGHGVSFAPALIFDFIIPGPRILCSFPLPGVSLPLDVSPDAGESTPSGVVLAGAYVSCLGGACVWFGPGEGGRPSLGGQTSRGVGPGPRGGRVIGQSGLMAEGPGRGRVKLHSLTVGLLIQAEGFISQGVYFVFDLYDC